MYFLTHCWIWLANISFVLKEFIKQYFLILKVKSKYKIHVSLYTLEVDQLPVMREKLENTTSFLCFLSSMWYVLPPTLHPGKLALKYLSRECWKEDHTRTCMGKKINDSKHWFPTPEVRRNKSQTTSTFELMLRCLQAMPSDISQLDCFYS